MTRSTIRIASAAACALLLAACGGADDPHGLGETKSPRAEAPRQVDRNSDGRVTREEAARDPKLAAVFERYDRNSDGALDRGEFARFEAPVTSPSRDAKPADEAEGAPMRPREEYPQPQP